MNDEIKKMFLLFEEIMDDEESKKLLEQADLESGMVDMNLANEIAMRIVQKRLRKEAIDKLNEFERERRQKKIDYLNKWRTD